MGITVRMNTTKANNASILEPLLMGSSSFIDPPEPARMIKKYRMKAQNNHPSQTKNGLYHGNPNTAMPPINP